MAFNFFYINTVTTTTKGVTVSYPKAEPNSLGTVLDVLNKFRWKNSGSVAEVPSLFLTEYSLDYGSYSANIARLLEGVSQAAAGSLDPYQVLYQADLTGFHYNLPYLVKPGTTLRGSISNSWKDSTQDIGNMAQDAFKAVGGGEAYKLLAGAAETVAGFIAPGYGAEPVQAFNNTNPNEITISFPLYNTTSISEMMDNYSFVSLLQFQNLKTRTSFLSYIPPKIYTVDGLADGGVYMPAAYISNLSIDSIGTTRSLKELGGVSSNAGATLIPEAYRVTITLKELIPQSSNIMYGVMGGKKVEVISVPPTGGVLDVLTQSPLRGAFVNPAIIPTETIGPVK
jgi:hypothetical protein